MRSWRGGCSKLRRQVKVEMRDGPPPDTSELPVGASSRRRPPKVPYYISHGSWSLLDKDENLLARGQYANDVPNRLVDHLACQRQEGGRGADEEWGQERRLEDVV